MSHSLWVGDCTGPLLRTEGEWLSLQFQAVCLCSIIYFHPQVSPFLGSTLHRLRPTMWVMWPYSPGRGLQQVNATPNIYSSHESQVGIRIWPWGLGSMSPRWNSCGCAHPGLLVRRHRAQRSQPAEGRPGIEFQIPHSCCQWQLKVDNPG